MSLKIVLSKDLTPMPYESVGYKIIQPASAYPGWPSDVVLPVEPLWKND